MNCKYWNDVELTEQLIKLERAHNLMSIYQRNGQAHKLFMLLSDMEMAAQKAQERLNQLEKERGVWDSVRIDGLYAARR